MKIFFLLALPPVFILYASLWGGANDLTNNKQITNSLVETSNEIRNGDFMAEGGVEELQSASSNISRENRMLLYNGNIRSWTWGLLDFAVPSLGNWLEGDDGGGKISLGFFLIGAICALDGLNIKIVGYGGNSQVLYTAGAVIIGGAYIYGLVSAFIFANDYNTRLMQGLDLTVTSQPPRYLDGYTGSCCVNIVNYHF